MERDQVLAHHESREGFSWRPSLPPREWPLRIADILDSIRLAGNFTAGTTFEDFRADLKTIYAVSRCLEIVGEAARHVPDSVQARYPDLPWAEMRGMRDVLSLQPGEDLAIVWNAATTRFPPVAPRLQEILKEAADGLSQEDSARES